MPFTNNSSSLALCLIASREGGLSGGGLTLPRREREREGATRWRLYSSGFSTRRCVEINKLTVEDDNESNNAVS